MSKISKNIKKQRSLNGMTQEDLAMKIHVTRQTVSSWETDRTQPDLEVLQALAAVFGIEVEELIYGKRKNTVEEKEKLLFGNTLLTVLSILGCLLIGAGVVMIFVKFWRDFPDALKIFTCFIPALSGQGIGIYTYIKKKESLPWREGASVLWMLGVAVTTVVIVNNAYVKYGMANDSWMYMFFALSAFVLMLVFKTLSPLAVVHVCSIMWFIFVLEEWNIVFINEKDSLGDVLKFVFAVALQAVFMAVTAYFSKKLYKKEDNIIRYTFASWINFGAFAAFISFAVARTEIGEAFISLLILSAIICFIIGQRHTDFISPYRALGLPASAAALCFLGIIFALGHSCDRWVDVLVSVICLTPFVLLFNAKTSPKSLYLRAYTALLTGALLVYNVISIFDDAVDVSKLSVEQTERFQLAEKGFFMVSFFLSLAALVMLIIYGAKERKLLYLNTGFILSCVTVIAKLYLLDLGLVVTGVLLIVCGAALLFINLKISRLREKERFASLAGEEEDLQ